MLENYVAQKLFPEELNRTERWETFVGSVEQLEELEQIIDPYILRLRNLNNLDLGKMLDKIEIRNNTIIQILEREYPTEKLKGMIFYTLVPKDRLDLGEMNLFLAKEFIRDLDKSKLKEFYWVWESGKYPDKPNLHLHLLCKFNGKSDNFARTLRIQWSKTFKGSTIDWRTGRGRGLDFKLCNTLRIQKDKVEYMENDLKGTHENFTNLHLKGYEGF